MDAERRLDPEGLLPLTLVALNIILAPADEERHGYGIEVRERTGGKMRLGPGTLYGSLKRMVEGGLVQESEGPAEEETDNGRGGYDAGRRRYYRLTGFGERVLAAELERVEGVVRTTQAKGYFPQPRNDPSPGGPEVDDARHERYVGASERMVGAVLGKRGRKVFVPALHHGVVDEQVRVVVLRHEVEPEGSATLLDEEGIVGHD
jgi:DNA-binding PadR family transcriptional regulator